MESFVNLVSIKALGSPVITKNAKGEISIDSNGKYLLISISSILCFLTYLLSTAFFKAFSSTYRQLPKKEKMFWSLAILRGIYGFVGTVGSAYERYFDQELIDQIPNGKTVLSYVLVLSHLGFFLFEWSAQIFFDIYFGSFSKELHAHHVICLSGFLLTTIHDIGHYYSLSCFILEMSTPFSCKTIFSWKLIQIIYFFNFYYTKFNQGICYCLIKSKMADSFLWKANQFLLIHIFHMRSIHESIMMYELYRDWSYYKHYPFLWQITTFGGLAAVGFYLTPYWTYRKTQQLFTKSDWNNDKKDKEN